MFKTIYYKFRGLKLNFDAKNVFKNIYSAFEFIILFTAKVKWWNSE